MKPVLPFPTATAVTPASSGAPLNAAAYLASVRAEAATLPAALVAAAPPPSPPPRRTPQRRGRGLAPPPPHAVPAAGWAAALLAALRRLQARGRPPAARDAAVPGARDAAGWRALIWEAAAARPSAGVVARLDYVRVVAALRCFDAWLEVVEDAGEGDGRTRATDALLMGARAHWLFALLVSLFAYVLEIPRR